MYILGKGERGFTLIELSIVLVIIGLIVGGVLVGQDLIRAAGVRAAISQIEKFNTAANTFRGKYGYLPGDVKDPDATSFGFQSRGASRGQGDGNGLIESTSGAGLASGSGEALLFWADLSKAGLIEGTYSTANASSAPGSAATGTFLDLYLPQSKLGGGNYMYVVSGGWNENGGSSDGANYYGLASVSALGSSLCTVCMISTPGLTVNQAYSIDKKVDDGLPLTGNVLAAFISSNNWQWAGINGGSGRNVPPPTTLVTPAASTTCFDNGGNNANPMLYSLTVSGSNLNCALTFRFQ